MISPDDFRHARIESVATAHPPHTFDQREAREIIERWLKNSAADAPVHHLLRIFETAGVSTRHSVDRPDRVMENIDFGERTRKYIDAARDMGRRAATDALERAGIGADQIDLFIFVSCTGFTIPSIDAHIINELPFRTDVRRLPINELGCAAGASALARAREFLLAYPSARVLILSVEAPTLVFQPTNFSAAQVVSSALFGDGAAAVVLAGETASPGNSSGIRPSIIAHETHFFRDTLDFMGYTNSATGFHIVLSPEIPRFMESHAGGVIREFLAASGLSADQISRWIVHPGSRRLLDIVDTEFGLNAAMDSSREVLQAAGNMSSATILFVLKQVMETGPADGEKGLMVAFGPGFSADLLLLSWRRGNSG